MVQMKEFRIVMPLAMEELQVGLMYMVMKMSQKNTTNSEGVEVMENKPFENDFGKGQYTLKNYRLQSKAPSWLTAFAPTDALVMQEEAWNAFPRCKSVRRAPLTPCSCIFLPHPKVLKCLYFTRFLLTIETIVKCDRGESENVHGLSEEQLAMRKVEMLDISSDTTDYWGYVIQGSNINLSQFKSARTGRGPLLQGWKDRCNPVVTVYKLVTIDAPYWGFGTRLEQFLIAGERALFIESFRNCFGWIDDWHGNTVETMQSMEKQIYSSLNKKLGRVSPEEEENATDQHSGIIQA